MDGEETAGGIAAGLAGTDTLSIMPDLVAQRDRCTEFLEAEQLSRSLAKGLAPYLAPRGETRPRLFLIGVDRWPLPGRLAANPEAGGDGRQRQQEGDSENDRQHASGVER